MNKSPQFKAQSSQVRTSVLQATITVLFITKVWKVHTQDVQAGAEGTLWARAVRNTGDPLHA